VNGIQAGQVFCAGGHVRDEGWFQGSLTELKLLTEDELEELLALVSMGRLTVDGQAPWSERAREVLPMLRGYADLDVTRFLTAQGMPASFVGGERHHLIAQANWRALCTAPMGERSEAYAGFIHSLMWLAPGTYGSTIEARCRTVAALAIANCPKRDEEHYDAEKDTAALIGKILHGDRRKDGKGHFTTPYWAQDYQPPVRRRGRRKGDGERHLQRLRGFLARHAEGTGSSMSKARS
jgi:hypothetical protein